MFQLPFLTLDGNSRSSLLSGLTSYWKLNESSGNRVDSRGLNNLTPNGTISGVPGKINNGAEFQSANTEYLSAADNPSLRPTGSFTLTGWIYVTAYNTANGVISKWGNFNGKRSFGLGVESSSVKFYVSDDGGSPFPTANAGVAALNTWHFLVGWHDADNDVIACQLNNAAPVVIAHSTGVAFFDNPLTVGALSTFPGFYNDGIVDEVGIWNRVLTPAERTKLYNSGNGLTYPFI
jgi:hypothetical protein